MNKVEATITSWTIEQHIACARNLASRSNIAKIRVAELTASSIKHDEEALAHLVVQIEAKKALLYELREHYAVYRYTDDGEGTSDPNSRVLVDGPWEGSTHAQWVASVYNRSFAEHNPYCYMAEKYIHEPGRND